MAPSLPLPGGGKSLASASRRLGAAVLCGAAPIAASLPHISPAALLLGLLSAAAAMLAGGRSSSATQVSNAAGREAVDPAAQGRAAFLAEVQARLDAAEPGGCALLVFQLKDVERLNALGAGHGQRVIAASAERLAETLGPSTPVQVIPGPALAALLVNDGGADALARQVRALTYVLGREIYCDGVSLTPELRAGVAVHERLGDRADDLLRSAEASASAREAPESVAFYSRARHEAERERFAMKEALKDAIVRDELSLHYQPVVDLASGRVASAEALLRWRRPDGRMTPPGVFVPLLEESGLVEEVGLWILNTACRQLRLWRAAGLPELRVAVNVSTRQFRDPRLAEVIARTLHLHGVPPSALEVELTETAAMQDAESTRRILAELKTLGVGVAIDDFGSGYSSLSYLRTLPFSKLKIDREFVTDVDTRSESRAICKAVIELARGLGMSILAEGAERVEEVDTLLGLGCPLFQGYYFSRPLEARAFADTIADPDWLGLLASPVHRRLAGLRQALA